MLTVRELFDWDESKYGELTIDVCDDYDERCYIAFVSGYGLTEAGKERFKDALDVEVIPRGEPTWILHTDSAIEAEACRDLFRSAAGFCTVSDYEEWFKENVSKRVCSICGKEFEGYGNNPYPVTKGEDFDDRCCDECNAKFVIPARIEMLKAERIGVK